MRQETKFWLLITILSLSNAIAQSDEILGSWKPFAVDNGDFYMNTKTDSIALYEEFDYIKNDSLKINQLKNIAAQIYFTQTHVFKEDGTYTQDLGMKNFELDYQIDRARKIILASERLLGGGKGNIEIPYSLENGILYLEIPMTEPAVKLWLKK